MDPRVHRLIVTSVATHIECEYLDAVGLAGRAHTPVLFGEAKWARSANGAALARALDRKADGVPGAGEDRLYALCARERLRDTPAGVITVTADDIFAI
jgi:hypothetical protein